MPTPDGLRSIYAKRPGTGIGIALGPDMGVVDFEIDDEAAALVILNKLHLPETLGWISARGQHRLYRYDERLGHLGDSAVIHLAGAEVRVGAQGKQLASVCPPSISDNWQRKWRGPWRLAPFPESLLRLIDDSQVAEKPAPKACVLPTIPNRYVAAALRNEVAAMRKAKDGRRNAQLNKSAYSLSGFIPSGLLDEETLIAALIDAAMDAGLSESEILTTLASGITAGKKRPRKV